MHVRGALLDVDGTLLDSNDAHAHAYVEAFRIEHVPIAFERVRPLIGTGSEKLLPALGVEPKSTVAERIGRAKKQIFAEVHLPKLRPFPAARDLLEVMKKAGLRLTVATSAGAEELSGLLHAAHIEDLIDAQSTSSDAKSSKPDPDVVEAAIERSGCAADELVMIGDTPYDVEAARRAGVEVVAVRCGGWSDVSLSAATAIYDDPRELLHRYASSIFATGKRA